MIVKRKIAVLGANLPLYNFYKRAKELRYEIHSFAWEEGAVCRPLSDFFYPISFTDTEEIISICKKNDIEMVTSFSLESALPYVYEISKALRCYVPSEHCRFWSLNKLTMRKLFKKYGVSVPQFIETSSLNPSIDDYPVIVKPIDSGGSRGVTKVLESAELSVAIQRAKKYSKNSEILIEQYIDGSEFSIEAISHQGQHYIAAITEKITSGPPNFVELAHFQPANLSAEKINQITSLVCEALTVLDYLQGPSHTEVKFDEDGKCYIIEIGLRLGGDFITSDLVRLSTGYDLVGASIEQIFGNFKEPNNELRKCAGVYFKAEGTLELWKNIEELKERNFYIEGEEWSQDIHSLTESSDRSGYMIYQNSERLKLNGAF